MSIVQSCQLIFFLNCKWHTEQAFCLWTQRNDSLWPTSQQSDEQTSALIDRNDLNSTDWGRTELISHKKDWCCCCSCCWEFVVGFFSLLWKTQILFLDKAKWIANINSTYNRLRLVLERTVRCSRTVRFLVMFGRFEVRFLAKMRYSKVFEVRSRSSANFTNI